MTSFKPALALVCVFGLTACEETTTGAAQAPGAGQIVVQADGQIVDQTGGQLVQPDGGIILEQRAGQVVQPDGGIILEQRAGQVVQPDGGIIIEQAGVPQGGGQIVQQGGGQVVQQASAPPQPRRAAGGRQNCARVLGFTVANGQRLAMIDTGQNTFFTPFETIGNNPNVCPFNEAELDMIQL